MVTPDSRARARLGHATLRDTLPPNAVIEVDPISNCLDVPLIFHGNADIEPPAYQPRKYRKCPSCFGRGFGARLMGSGKWRPLSFAGSKPVLRWVWP